MSLPTSSITSSSQHRIAIIGAGIAGLTLANLLQRSNINFHLYEARGSNSIGHSYAITLFRRPWRNLVNRLSAKHAEFRQETAADRLVGGTGKATDQTPESSATFQAIDRDVRQWLVQRLQNKGAEIHWEHKLSSIVTADNERGASLTFEGKEPIHADIIIDAGGLRSPAFNSRVSTAPKPKLLPYATYNGSRRISADEFSDRFAHYFRSGNTIEFVPEDSATPFIQIKKTHLSGDGGKQDVVELRWVYSRPAKDGSDALYRPGRTPEDAKIIPEEFYSELQETIDRDFHKKQRSLLKAFFDLSDVHNDRILNWHLRLRLPPLEHFVENSTSPSYQVIAIGDAAHGLPIVESRGAGHAAEDASNLARWLQKHVSDDSNFQGDTNYYKVPSVHREWVKETAQAVQRLRQCHGQSQMSSSEMQGILGLEVEDMSAENLASGEASSSSDGETVEANKGRL